MYKEELEYYNIHVNKLSDNDQIKISIYLLENLKDWWGLCFNSKEEEKLYSNLFDIIKDLKKLFEDNNKYCDESECE